MSNETDGAKKKKGKSLGKTKAGDRNPQRGEGKDSGKGKNT